MGAMDTICKRGEMAMRMPLDLRLRRLLNVFPLILAAAAFDVDLPATRQREPAGGDVKLQKMRLVLCGGS